MPYDSLLDVLMNAPEDDEPLSDEDLAAIAEGKAAVLRGDVGPLIPVEAQREIIKGATNKSTGFTLNPSSVPKRFVTIKQYLDDPTARRPKRSRRK